MNVNLQKGFIQIPILIAIIISAIIFGGGGYLIARKISKPPSPQIVSESSVAITMTKQATSTEKVLVENKKTTSSSLTNSLNLSAFGASKTPAPKKEENVWQYVVEWYASDAEWFRRNIEEVRSGKEIPDMKSRRDRIAKLLSDIRSTPFLSFSEGATFNEALDLYGDAVKEEIMNIDKRLAAIESNLTSMDNYRVEFNRKVSSLLADPNKFIPASEYHLYLEEAVGFVDKRFEGIENINKIFSAHYQGVIDKIDQVQQITAILQREISKLSALTTVKAPSPQPIIISSPAPWVPQIPKTTTCTLIPGPSGGFAYATVQCN